MEKTMEYSHEPEMEFNDNAELDLFKNVEMVASINLILNIDEIFNESYFIHFSEEIDYLSKKLKTNKTDIKDIFNSYLNGLLYTLHKKEKSFEPVVNSDMLYLLFDPILNNSRINKKTYRDFNISLEYFNNLREYNTEMREAGDYENVLIIKDFTFKKLKLNKFTLYRDTYNMSYEYDQNYELLHIVFSDGSKTKIFEN